MPAKFTRAIATFVVAAVLVLVLAAQQGLIYRHSVDCSGLTDGYLSECLAIFPQH